MEFYCLRRLIFTWERGPARTAELRAKHEDLKNKDGKKGRKKKKKKETKF